MNEKEAARAISALQRERPEWLPVLEAALVVAERSEPYGGEFAGAWVLDELKQRTGRQIWLPNLRLLVTCGLLEKAGESSRRRAYYRFVDRETTGRVLSTLRTPHAKSAERPSARFTFIGAGDSKEPASDMARRSGEIAYKPRSWR